MAPPEPGQPAAVPGATPPHSQSNDLTASRTSSGAVPYPVHVPRPGSAHLGTNSTQPPSAGSVSQTRRTSMNLARTSNTLARVSNTLATHAAQLVESVGHAVSAGAELAGELAASAPAMVANTAGLGAAASVGPGDQDGHIKQDYDDLVQEAIHALPGRTSLEVVLPKAALMGKGSGCLDAALKEAAKDTLTVELPLLAKAGPQASAARQLLLDHAMQTKDQDNEVLLKRIKQRMDKVGLSWPTVEVVFKDLEIGARIKVGTRGRPSVANFYINQAEQLLNMTRIMRPDTRTFPVLDSMSGVLKPGRLTLLLGPPGSGKSTLLRALAGVAADGKDGLNVRGAITYNGTPLDAFNVRRTAAYVDQVDNHIAELTVRETLGFAAASQGAGVLPELVGELRKREKAAGITPDPVTDAYLKALAQEGSVNGISVDTMLRVLGLEVCADTIVGNNMLRGVSGGQRKRVTTGEFLVGPARVLFLDEISTGLDSSTTWLLTNCLRNMAHMQQMTILVALLQPPPEVYALFDDIMFMSDGRLVFHGPREQCAPFFRSVGFAAPPRKGEADFLQEVTSRKDQGQYWVGPGPYSFVPVAHFEAAFRASAEGRARAAECESASHLQVHVVPATCGKTSPSKAADEKGAAFLTSKADSDMQEWSPDPLVRENFAPTPYQNLMQNMWRDAILMKRLGFMWIFKTVMTVFVGIIFSTLFLSRTMDTGSIQGGRLFLGCIFYSITHAMFNGYVEMGILVSTLRVFFKQRNAKFFPAWAFTMPPVLLRVPFSLADGIMWSLLIYWIIGLAPSPGRFFIFLAYMVGMSQMALAIFRMCAAAARNLEAANSFGSTALIILLIVGGFILSKTKMHPWWVWVYWLNPITHAQLGLSISEMTAARWQSKFVEYKGVTMSLGDAVLESQGLFKDRYYIFTGILVMIGYMIVFQFLAYIFLQYLDEPGRDAPMFSEEFLSWREANVTGAPLPAPAHGASNTTGRRSLNLTRKCDKKENSKLGKEVQLALPAAGGDGDMRRGLSAVREGASSEGGASDDVESTGLSATAKAPVQRQGTSGNVGGANLVLPFRPLTVAFRNLCYEVPMPKDAAGYEAAAEAAGGAVPQLRLLTNITGTFRPGVLTALMGVSGAGKTTLMDVLAGRKNTGTVTGDIFVGGFPKVQSTFSRVCGYVEQNDIHSARTTVREALQLSAQLRLYDADKPTQEAFVDEVLELVELGTQRDALVGMPGVFGLSVEQRKRLTIAVELVANPSVVFMDEPTSGLDARAAAIVMRAVRATVDTGRTVVCTIHQPSIEIFEAFDELLLLKRGGRTIYHGPLGTHAESLVAYFQGLDARIPAHDPTVNASNWMLDISTITMERKLGLDFADAYADSQLCASADALSASLCAPQPGDEELKYDVDYAQGLVGQFWVLLRRFAASYWRNPTYNGVRYTFCVILGLLLGSIYWDMGTKRSNPLDLFNVMGALFLCIMFLGTYNTSNVLPVLATERPVFYRERAANMYAVLPYGLALGVIELPYIAVQSALYSVVTYFMIQFEFTAAKFFWYLLFVFLTLSFFTFFGLMLMAVMPLPELANVVSSMFYSIWFVFAGFFISEPAMPKWWFWFYWLDPVSYMLYGIISSQLGDVENDYVDSGDGSVPVTVKKFIKDAFDFKYSFTWATAVIMIAYTLFFWGIFIFAMKRFNFSHR